MNIDINTNNINSSGSARSRGTTPATANATKATVSPETVISNSKDNVVLSAEAQNLSRLQSKLNDLPDVNLERVAAIRQAIAEGRFEIDPERIAENMLNQDELLN